jgi:hypothetical protein
LNGPAYRWAVCIFMDEIVADVLPGKAELESLALRFDIFDRDHRFGEMIGSKIRQQGSSPYP